MRGTSRLALFRFAGSSEFALGYCDAEALNNQAIYAAMAVRVAHYRTPVVPRQKERLDDIWIVGIPHCVRVMAGCLIGNNRPI
jgi:hypothetical protein